MGGMEKGELLSLPIAAKELGMSHTTLWRLVKAGKVTSVKVGNSYGIYRDDLDAFRKIERPIGRPRKQPPAP